MVSKEHYNFAEKNKASREFGRLFELPLGDFYDPLISFWESKICIDIIKFDERMHQEWGDYESKGESLSDCIAEHYGQEAVAFLDKLI